MQRFTRFTTRESRNMLPDEKDPNTIQERRFNPVTHMRKVGRLGRVDLQTV